MTIELTKTQIEALQSGAAHDAGHITIPKTLRGGARQKVVASLVTAKLAAYRAGTLVITTAGMAAIGEVDDAVGAAGRLRAARGRGGRAAGLFRRGAWCGGRCCRGRRHGRERACDDRAERERRRQPTTARPRRPSRPSRPRQPTSNEPATAEPTEPAPADVAQPARATRTGTKQAQLIEMLKRPEGVTVDEVVKALDWQAHTVRGAMAGALKKKLGLTIESEKVDERGRVYRIVG